MTFYFLMNVKLQMNILLRTAKETFSVHLEKESEKKVDYKLLCVLLHTSFVSY